MTIVYVPGYALEHALDDCIHRWDDYDIRIVKWLRIDYSKIEQTTNYPFDLDNDDVRRFLELVCDETEYRIESIKDMISIDGGEDYHPAELRVLIPFHKRLSRTLSYCEIPNITNNNTEEN